MPKQTKRMTRAEKVALSKVKTKYQTAAEIGVDAETLDSLVARGYVATVSLVGPPQYRITENGTDALPQKHADAHA